MDLIFSKIFNPCLLFIIMGIAEDKVKLCLLRIKEYNKLINAFLEVKDENQLTNEAKVLDSKKTKGKIHIKRKIKAR